MRNNEIFLPLITAHNVKEVEPVNDLETPIFTAKAIEMGIIGD
jgi:hypothetical protein